MAKGIHLLIQLAQRQMDERRVDLQQATSACMDADAAIADHEASVDKEVRSAQTDTATLITLGAWTRHASEVRSGLHARHAELRGDEAAARDLLRDAFVDLKRLELAQDQAARNARLLSARHADRAADDQQTLMRVDAAA